MKIIKNWVQIYQLQDVLLQKLRLLPHIFLASGTAIQRFILVRQQRESDDLDFFLPEYYDKSIHEIVRQIREAIVQKSLDNEEIRIENYVNNNDGVYRFFCSSLHYVTPVKLELLNCTSARYLDTTYYSSALFPRIENVYNLILYKLKALCDRRDTVKDLFDLFFLLKETSVAFDLKILFMDLQMKFAESTGYIYNEEYVLDALLAKHRQWDIVLMNHLLPVEAYLKEAIDDFRKEFITQIASCETRFLELSYDATARKKFPEMSIDEYYEYVEANVFVSTEYSFWRTAQQSGISDVPKL